MMAKVKHEPKPEPKKEEPKLGTQPVLVPALPEPSEDDTEDNNLSSRDNPRTNFAAAVREARSEVGDSGDRDSTKSIREYISKKYPNHSQALDKSFSVYLSAARKKDGMSKPRISNGSGNLSIPQPARRLALPLDNMRLLKKLLAQQGGDAGKLKEMVKAVSALVEAMGEEQTLGLIDFIAE